METLASLRPDVGGCSVSSFAQLFNDSYILCGLLFLYGQESEDRQECWCKTRVNSKEVIGPQDSNRGPFKLCYYCCI